MFLVLFTRNSLEPWIFSHLNSASRGARTSTPHLMISWNSLRWCIGSVLLGVAKAWPPSPHKKKSSHVHRKFHHFLPKLSFFVYVIPSGGGKQKKLPNGAVYSMIHQSCWWIVTPQYPPRSPEFFGLHPTSPPRQRQHILQEVQVDLHLGIWEVPNFWWWLPGFCGHFPEKAIWIKWPLSRQWVILFSKIFSIWSCQNTKFFWKTILLRRGFFNGIPTNLHCQEFKHPNAAMAQWDRNNVSKKMTKPLWL